MGHPWGERQGVVFDSVVSSWMLLSMSQVTWVSPFVLWALRVYLFSPTSLTEIVFYQSLRRLIFSLLHLWERQVGRTTGPPYFREPGARKWKVIDHLVLLGFYMEGIVPWEPDFFHEKYVRNHKCYVMGNHDFFSTSRWNETTVHFYVLKTLTF